MALKKQAPPIDYEADAQTDNMDGGKLARVSQLAQQQISLLRRLEELNAATVEATNALAEIQEHQLPDAMIDLGLKKLTLDDGSELGLAREYFPNIGGEREALAFAWLREQEHDSMIKNEFKLWFGKGEDGKALRLLELLEAEALPFNKKESIHSGTLRKFVRELAEAGTPVPDDIFHVSIINKVTVKRPKNQRGAQLL
jgi:hypothetical protein